MVEVIFNIWFYSKYYPVELLLESAYGADLKKKNYILEFKIICRIAFV